MISFIINYVNIIKHCMENLSEESSLDQNTNKELELEQLEQLEKSVENVNKILNNEKTTTGKKRKAINILKTLKMILII